MPLNHSVTNTPKEGTKQRGIVSRYISKESQVQFPTFLRRLTPKNRNLACSSLAVTNSSLSTGIKRLTTEFFPSQLSLDVTFAPVVSYILPRNLLQIVSQRVTKTSIFISD